MSRTTRYSRFLRPLFRRARSLAPPAPPRPDRGLSCGVLAAVLWALAPAPAVSAAAMVFETVPGIPRGVVATLAQDRAGWLWVATGDGVVRHDGQRFRPVEGDDPDPARRNLGWVRALLPTPDGRTWIGTESAGLAVHDPATDRVQRLALGPMARSAVSADALPTVSALARSADGSVWVGWMGGGLSRIRPAALAGGPPAAGDITHYRALARAATGAAGGLPDDRVLALHVDARGTLWVGSYGGLLRVRDPAAAQPVFQTVLAAGPQGRPARVQALLQAADGRLWLGTQQGDLAWLDVPADATTAPPAPRWQPDPAGAVTALAQDSAGRLWVGRSSGIDLHDAASGARLQRLRHDRRRSDGLGANEVSSLLRDRSGAVWVGGFGLGLQRHRPPHPALRWLAPGPAVDVARAGPWTDPDLRHLLVLDDGRTWAAAHGGGIVAFDAALQPVALLGGPRPGSRALRAEAMAQAADGTVWVAAGGLLHQHDRQGRWLRTRAPGGPAAPGAEPFPPVRQLHAAADGSLWLATDDGLHRLPPGAAVAERVARADGSPLQGAVLALATAPDGSLWVGGVAGLWRLPPGGRALQPVQAPADAALGNPVVTGLLFDAQGTLWLDTPVAGLHRMRSLPAAPRDGAAAPRDGAPAMTDTPAPATVATTGAWPARFERISERHGHVGRPFGANLRADRRGRIWTHMHLYDPASDRLHELTASDGVRFGTGWFGAHAALPDGRLLFGGSRGLMVVDAAGYEVSTAMPPLVLAELQVNHRPRPAALPPEGLVLGPQDRSLRLEFAALDYAEPGRIRYAWQLQGYDSDWVRPGSGQRTATYGQLPPGAYTLNVRASNAAGLWSESALLQIPLQVQPAWWQRTDLRAAAGVAAALLGVAAVRGHTRSLRRRQQALEAEVQRRTAQLREASLTDPLTGLRNRRYLAQHIDADTALAVRRHEGTPPSTRGAAAATAPEGGDADLVFFLVDIDHFKQVNDRHGHDSGDAVLVQMRQRLGSVFRDSDHILRWGGEEFLVVARGTSRRHAAELAERLRAAVADTPFTRADGVPLVCTCSIGFAAFPLCPAWPRALDWAATLRLADAALYRVKGSGRDGWLGLVAARAGSEIALQAQAAGPLPAWQATGTLDVAQRPGADGGGLL